MVRWSSGWTVLRHWLSEKHSALVRLHKPHDDCLAHTSLFSGIANGLWCNGIAVLAQQRLIKMLEAQRDADAQKTVLLEKEVVDLRGSFKAVSSPLQSVATFDNCFLLI
jgi:hypothetical protein